MKQRFETFQFNDIPLGCGSFDGGAMAKVEGDGNGARCIIRIEGQQLNWTVAVQDGNGLLISIMGEHELEAFLTGMEELRKRLFPKNEP